MRMNDLDYRDAEIFRGFVAYDDMAIKLQNDNPSGK